MKIWLIIALLSAVVFISGLFGSIKADRYIFKNGMLEGKPSIIRQKATIRMIIAYEMLFAAFAIYYFQLLP